MLDCWLQIGWHDEARRLADRALEFRSSQSGFAHALHLLGDTAAHPISSMPSATRLIIARRRSFAGKPRSDVENRPER
jgi:hypothetical protein